MGESEKKDEVSLVEKIYAIWQADASISSNTSYFGAKADRCAQNLALNTGVGFTVGLISSLVFFRSPTRGKFLIGLTTGCGIGNSYSTCKFNVYSEK